MAGNWYLVRGGRRRARRHGGEELRRDRVRALLRRYGVLFRELLERELPPLRWGELFRTLRLMELSGRFLPDSSSRACPACSSPRMRQSA